MSKFEDYLTRRTREYVKGLMSRSFNANQPKNPDIIRFTNPQKTKGVNSNGQEVNTVIHGSPGETALGYLTEPSGKTYVCWGPDPAIVNIDGAPSIGYLLASLKSDPVKIYVNKIGGSTAYFWLSAQDSIPPFSSSAGKQNSFGFTTNGKHLVTTFFNPSINSFTTQVWKNFTLGSGIVSSDSITSYTGTLPTSGGTPFGQQLAYTKIVNGTERVYVDLILYNGSSTPSFTSSRNIKILDGVCPELSEPGTLTEMTFQDLWGFDLIVFDYFILNTFRSTSSNTAMMSFNSIVTLPQYSHVFRRSVPKPSLATIVAKTSSSNDPDPIPVYRQIPNGGVYTSDEHWIGAEDYIPGMSTASPRQGEGFRTKFLDTNKFVVQLNNGPTDDPNVYDLELQVYNRGESSWTAGKSVSGNSLFIDERDSSGVPLTTGLYRLLDIAITNTVGHVT